MYTYTYTRTYTDSQESSAHPAANNGDHCPGFAKVSGKLKRDDRRRNTREQRNAAAKGDHLHVAFLTIFEHLLAMSSKILRFGGTELHIIIQHCVADANFGKGYYYQGSQLPTSLIH